MDPRGQSQGYLFSAYLVSTKEDLLNCFTQSGDGGFTRFFARDATHNFDQERQEPLQTYTDNIGVSFQPHDDPPQYAESSHPPLADSKNTD
ncbi:hypothetical protein ABC855_g2657 [[Candida] zeylanoides]